MTQLVIVGGGHAAAQLCASLAEKKFAGKIILVTDEPHVPYHRPPLSKTLIKDGAAAMQELKGAAFYEQAGVELRLATRVESIDREHKTLQLTSPEGASQLAYDHLVLATGAKARELPDLPDGTPGVFYLRNFAHAVALRGALLQANRVIVLGGGFIGLEVAATAHQLGKQVTVFEAMPRLLARAVSPQVSDHLLAVHRAAGIDIRLGAPVQKVEIGNGSAVAVIAQGERLEADVLIAGIGADPDVSLARAAGLLCDNGIVVDDLLQTSDSAVSAVGDCTSFPHPAWHAPLRLESVQNANDQAKTAAARLCGDPQPYTAMPWFWSDQGEVRLQITGLWRPGYHSHVRPAAKGNGFSVFHYDDAQQLRAVESLNSPVDQMGARKLLQAGLSPAPGTVGDPTVPLKA
jgi:3-phenylpropionate/trans-cinnamate dioxygenase ferredoxin reductase subunit